jgi:ketosteroid isomerase-like protein
MKRIRAKLVALAALALLSSSAGAQADRAAAAEDTLFRQIAASDSDFFDAYNNCELPRMKAYFTTDIEFYHDQSGLSHLLKLMSDLQKNICGKVHRDPVPGTLEVYPLKGYGAVATGLHRFCDSRKYRTCEEGASGVAKFVTLWRRQNGKWRMSRVISYDHASSH